MKIALGLGSNLGDRKNFLLLAMHFLMEHKIVTNPKRSSIVEFPALLLENSPKKWDKPFLNCVMTGDTTLQIEEILSNIHLIEHDLGRKRTKKWAPREIDIDILLYGTKCIHTNKITVPHYELLDRDFFLLPLDEVAPDWIYPMKGKYYNMTISQIAKMIYD